MFSRRARRANKVVAGVLSSGDGRSEKDFISVAINNKDPRRDGNTFVVPKNYRAEKEIGHGAYGVVISAVDELTGKKVRTKKSLLFLRSITPSHPNP